MINSSSLVLEASWIALSAAFVVHVTRVRVCALGTEYFNWFCLQIWQFPSENIFLGDRAKTTNTTHKSILDSGTGLTELNKQIMKSKTKYYGLMSKIYSFKIYMSHIKVWMFIHTVYHSHKTLSWCKIELPVWRNSWERQEDECVESLVGVLLVVFKYFLLLFTSYNLWDVFWICPYLGSLEDFGILFMVIGPFYQFSYLFCMHHSSNCVVCRWKTLPSPIDEMLLHYNRYSGKDTAFKIG